MLGQVVYLTVEPPFWIETKEPVFNGTGFIKICSFTFWKPPSKPVTALFFPSNCTIINTMLSTETLKIRGEKPHEMRVLRGVFRMWVLEKLSIIGYRSSTNIRIFSTFTKCCCAFYQQPSC